MAENFGIAFQPQDVTLDFKKATHATAKSIWHQIRIKGCHFHLSQAWYRKIASLGLSDAYKTADSDIGVWLKQFFGLSFLSAHEIQDCFTFDLMDDAPANNRCEAFGDYVLSTYVSDEATFPPHVWAHPDLNTIT